MIMLIMQAADFDFASPSFSPFRKLFEDEN